MPPILRTFSDEINYLIWRYLRETNLTQTAWTLEAEIKSKSGKDILAVHDELGKNLSFDLPRRLRMSMQYQEVLKHMSEDGDLQCTEAFTLLSEHKCNRADDTRVPIPDVVERPWQLEAGNFPHGESLQLTNAAQQPRQSRRLNKEENGPGAIPNSFAKGLPPASKKRRKPNNIPAVGVVEEEESNVDDEMDEDTVVMNGEDVVMKDATSVKSEPDAIQVIPNDGPIQFGDPNTIIAAWNDKAVLATGQEGMVRMWTVHSRGENRVEAQPLTLPINTSGDVTALCWHPKDSLLAAGTFAGLTTIWNTDGALRSTLPSPHGPIFNLNFNPSGTLLVTASASGVFEIYDTREFVSLFKSTATARVWETKPNIPSLVWLDDSRFAIVGPDSPHAAVNCWQCDETHAPSRFLQFLGHEGLINDIQYDSSSAFIATASEDKTVQLWKTDKSSPYHVFRHHMDSVLAVGFQPQREIDTPILASASFDGTVAVYDLRAFSLLYSIGKEIHNFPGDRISCLSWSPDGKYVCTGDLEGVVGIWEWRDNTGPRPFAIWAPERIREDQQDSLTNGLNGHKDDLDRPVYRIHWQKNGQSFVVCREHRKVALIDWPVEQVQ